MTTVTIETDRHPPPLGTKRRKVLEDNVRKAVAKGLTDNQVTINIVRRS